MLTSTDYSTEYLTNRKATGIVDHLNMTMESKMYSLPNADGIVMNTHDGKVQILLAAIKIMISEKE